VAAVPDEEGAERGGRWRIPVGRLLGVPLALSPGLVLVGLAAVTAWGLGGGPWARVVLLILLVGTSLLAHELAHGVVARRAGYRVDGITLSLLGGVTAWSGESPSPHVAVRIAAAGPATSAVLAVLFVAAGEMTGDLEGLLQVGAAVNLLDALVNLLPLPTSDGLAIARALRRPRPATTGG
jgi:Zn-dependent protease